MSTVIIDRRKNASGRSLPNRQRFMERVRKDIKEHAKRSLGSRTLGDKSDSDVTVPSKGIGEPRFSHDPGAGEHDYVLPGNETYSPGDRIRKPDGGGGSGRGTEGGIGQEGEDDFTFSIDYKEFLDIIFDDLELPDLSKKSANHIHEMVQRRAGFTTAGSPSNLDVERTMMSSLSRRIALKTPKISAIMELERELETTTDEARRLQIIEEIADLRRRANTIGFLDNVDLRYRNFIPTPKPITQAVMICIMDVSFSMGEREKTIAKKFFLLLSLFLQRRYERMDIVFIRHHETAQECDENTFFNDRVSGGTVVSTSYKEASRIIAERYPAADWNIYIAQASDGDNYGHDNPVVEQELRKLLPITQYMAYIQIGRERDDGSLMGTLRGHFSPSGLWEVLETLAADHPALNCKRIGDEKDVIQVFRSLFARARAEEAKK